MTQNGAVNECPWCAGTGKRHPYRGSQDAERTCEACEGTGDIRNTPDHIATYVDGVRYVRPA